MKKQSTTDAPRNYAVAPGADGNYQLGPDSKYRLSAKALQHILKGDVTTRPVRINGAHSHNEHILAGGLHTADGWEDLRGKWPTLVHGATFRSDRDVEELWYFARELQNEVILLKIPRHVFQRNAAKLTQFSDVYYKSGYLWKSLFPKRLATNEIVAIINETLFHLDKEESTDAVPIGYALLDDPLKTIKVRVQLTGTDINSAFPTWGQPNTGNNGKPYSHADSIGFYVSESMEAFSDKPKYRRQFVESNVAKELMSPADLIASTPVVFLDRPDFSRIHDRHEAHEKWKSSLSAVAQSLDHDGASQLYRYMSDIVFLKEPVGIVQSSYSDCYEEIAKNQQFRNAVSTYQNLIDGFRVLAEFDKTHNTAFAKSYADLYLKSRFIQTGGVDLWEAVRFHAVLTKWVTNTGDSNVMWHYLKTLATSPNRIARYTPFDFNVFAGHDGTIIGISDPKMTVREEHVYRFVGNNLGLSYIRLLNGNQRSDLASKMQREYCRRSSAMIADLVASAQTADFVPFAHEFGGFAKAFVANLPQDIDSETLELIAYDYYRIMAISHFRARADNYWLTRHRDKLDWEDRINSGFWLFTKFKHERQWIDLCITTFMTDLETIAKKAGFTALEQKAVKWRDEFHQERIPLPKLVPRGLTRYKIPRKKATEDMLDNVFDAMFETEPGGDV